MTPEKIKRINELAKKSRETTLSKEELVEQQSLRREYIDAMKSSLTNSLEKTYILDPDGTKRKIAKKPKSDR